MAESLSVAIIPGFSEGRHHSRGLRHALLEAGFVLARKPEQADIIIAHSGGCMLVPQAHKARAVLFVNYTYWPSRSLGTSLRMKLAEERRRVGTWQWLKNCALHDAYILNPFHTLKYLRVWPQRGGYLADLDHGQYFIHNRHDPYSNPDSLVAMAGDSHAYISLPGYHDELWDDPTPYVHLLQSLL